MRDDPLSHPLPGSKSQHPAELATGEKESCIVLLGAGFAPIPSKLVKKIEEGNFVDMHELLPERLGAADESDQSRLAKNRGKMVTDILEWVRCFGLYVAIISRKYPERVPDLLSYQALILDAHKEYPGDHWIGYDRRFRQRAAATRSTKWSDVEPTLWNLAFAGRAHSSRCKFCFSISHHSNDCDLAPDVQASPRGVTSILPRPSLPFRRPVCYDWNEDPAPGCPRRGCKFEHICYLCVRDANVKDRNHKAVLCPNHIRDRPTRQQK